MLSRIRESARKAAAKLARADDAYEPSEDERRLVETWKKRFAVDKRQKEEWDERFEYWESLYSGKREFGNLTNDIDKTPRTLINWPKRFIEQHLDLNIPEPDLKPVAEDDEFMVKRLEGQVKYTIRASQPSLEEMNQQDERRVKKYGGCFRKVHWNNALRRAGYVGDVELSNPHPKHIVPNAGATSIDDMEHYHHVVNRTGNYIVRRWPHITLDALEKWADLDKGYDELTGKQDIEVTQEATHEPDSGLAKYTVVETTYRDEDGDICKFWWSGDLPIKHVPKFYYRRDERGQPLTEETATQPVQVFVGWGATGEPQFRVVEEGEKIPLYVPTCWDIVYQPRIPRDLCFWGISVYEDVADAQESVNKMVYGVEEQILKGRTKIFTTDEELKNRIQDPLSEVILTSDLNLVKEVQFGGDLEGHLAWLRMMKEVIQEMMGAENPVMGKPSPNVTSGRQAEMYIAQAQAMADAASAAKTAAYKRLYRVIADFHLAFSDYDRPYRLEGQAPDGGDVYGTFNRLNMLRDRQGHLVYPDYDVEIGAESGFMRQKSEILQMLTWLASGGRFEARPDNLVLLRVLDKLGVPHLKEAIRHMEDVIRKQEAAAQAQTRAMVTRQQQGGVVPGGAQQQGQGAQAPPGIG